MAYFLAVENLRVAHSDCLSFFIDPRNPSIYSNKTIVGDGYFEVPFARISEGYPRRGLSTANVTFYLNEAQIDSEAGESNQTVSIHWIKPYSDGLPSLKVSIGCESTLYGMIQSATETHCKVEIKFEVVRWEVDEDETSAEAFEYAEANLCLVETKKTYEDSKFIDCQIRDIRSHLLATNCPKYHDGQVAAICTEISESFRDVPSTVNKNELIDAVTSLITNCRYYLHKSFDAADQSKVDTLKKKYGIDMSPYPESWPQAFEKIADPKDKVVASQIFNHLWTTRPVAYAISHAGHYPIDADVATSIADEYLALNYLKSDSLERLLVDMLIGATAVEKANSLSQLGHLSAGTRSAVSSTFYNENDNSTLHGLGMAQFIMSITVYLAARLAVTVIHGIFLWWISGLISGDNHTAQIVLFGSLFSASLVTGYLYTKSEGAFRQVPKYVDEKSFYVLRDLCNLHSMVWAFRSSAFKSLLNKCCHDGTRFPNALYRLIG